MGTANAPEKNRSGAVAWANRGRFFSGMSALLVFIVVAGFARTLYLRAYLGLPKLPVHLYVHGTIFTLWILVVFVQVYLVATHRTHIHRRLGIAALVVAACAVAVSLLTLAIRDAPSIDQAPQHAFGNIMSLVAFSSCLLSGVLLRNRPAAHKRLMLMATVPIVGPALDRMARLPPLSDISEAIFADLLGSPNLAFATAGVLVLLLAFFVHDAVSERRVHPASIWGVVCIFGIGPAVTAALTFTGVWAAFVHLVAR